MTKEQLKELEALLEMFQSEGWKVLVKELEKELQMCKDSAADTCTTSDSWQFARGYMTKLKQMAGYEMFIKAVYEQEMEPSHADV